MNEATVVATIWEQVLRESPAPEDGLFWWNMLLGLPRPSYRERLDRLPRNVYGEPIPRIVTVRRNLRALGKPRRAPRLPE